jgi:hypothetical protein
MLIVIYTKHLFVYHVSVKCKIVFHMSYQEQKSRIHVSTFYNHGNDTAVF